MIGSYMPQDILKYKSKFVLGLTTRQCIFYFVGLIAGLLGFFYLFAGISSINIRAVLTGAVCIPFFVWGKIEPFGENPEKVIIPLVVDNFLSPAVRKKEVHFPEYEKKEPVKARNKRDYAVKSKQFKAYR